MERKQPKCVEIGPGPCLACADAQATIAALEETILKMGENAAVVAKDAMAAKEQVAALQARVKELEEWVQDQSTANLETMRHTDEMQSRAMEAEQQLTQRTAELEAANDKVQFLEKKNRNLLDSENLTLKVKADQDVRLADLQAELERVRADNKALDEWRADVTVSLQRPGGAFFVDVPQHIKDLVKERDDLRALILALPKVEGEILEQGDFAFVRYAHVDGPLPEIPRREQIALLQHRQGMEG